MKKVIALVSLLLIHTGVVFAAEPVSSGGLNSLRGEDSLSSVRKAESMKQMHKDGDTIDRNYVHQPPLIPHQIRDYQINTNANKCLSCHGWKYASQAGATRVSPTHFVTRDGITLSDVSPGRYFCTQCHVPQADAAPLIANEFKAVESIK